VTSGFPATVKRVTEYPSFEEMLDREDVRSTGGDLGESRGNLLAVIRTSTRQRRNGWACSPSRSSWRADERYAASHVHPHKSALVPLSEAKARLSELARRVRQQHERITLTRNGKPEAVLLSVDDLEGLEMTLEILSDTDAAARISDSLAALGRGEPGAGMATVRRDLVRRRVTGA
jgi:antitoxin YefM